MTASCLADLSALTDMVAKQYAAPPAVRIYQVSQCLIKIVDMKNIVTGA